MSQMSSSTKRDLSDVPVAFSPRPAELTVQIFTEIGISLMHVGSLHLSHRCPKIWVGRGTLRTQRGVFRSWMRLVPPRFG
jgi:hypothetical protein